MFSHNPKLNCIQNAFINFLKAKENGLDAEIWFVGGDIKHAYLQIEDNILNEGVTWGNNSYPDFTLEELQELQEQDIAHIITEEAERAFSEDDLLYIEGQERSFPINRPIIEKYL